MMADVARGVGRDVGHTSDADQCLYSQPVKNINMLVMACIPFLAGTAVWLQPGLQPLATCSKLLNHQDPLYRYDGYLSLMEFREQTLQRLQKFVAQRFFTVRDYLDSKEQAVLGSWQGNAN
jgi:hypothetical protein